MNTLAFTQVLGGLKSIGDITKGLVEIRDTAVFGKRVGELLGIIISTQTDLMAALAEQSSLIERIRMLEAEIAQSKNWEAEKSRYELKELGRGTYALALKPVEGSQEPPHWICAGCADKGIKSILQRERHAAFSGCPSCKTVMNGCC